MLILSLLLGCGQGPDLVVLDPAASATFFQDVAVFPATGPERLLHQDVLVQGERVVSLGPTGGAPPEGAVTVPGAGRTLLPGLVDSHTHLLNNGAAPGKLIPPDPAHNLEAWLAAGVTTIYDLGGDTEKIQRLVARGAAGEIAAPRIFYTASPITFTEAHPIPAIRALAPAPLAGILIKGIPQVSGPEEAEAIVAATVAQGVDYVKIIYDALPPGAPQMDAETLGALVAAAHRAGKPAVVHIGDEQNALDAVRAGADLLAHGVYRGGLSDEGVAELVASGVPMIPTLSGFQQTALLAAGQWQASGWDHRLVDPKIYGPLEGPSGGAFFQKVPVLASFSAGIDPNFADNVRRLSAAGELLLVGTDSVLPAAYAGAALHQEIAALAAAGLSPTEILLGATSRPAQLFGATPDWGTVEPGKVADLLLVEGDPTADVAALEHIVGVWRAGRPVRWVAEAGG